MTNKTIVVNCANVRAAQQRLQKNAGIKPLSYSENFAFSLLPLLETLEANGPWSRLAQCLNAHGLVTPAGKRWGPVSVNRLIATLANLIRISEHLDAP